MGLNVIYVTNEIEVTDVRLLRVCVRARVDRYRAYVTLISKDHEHSAPPTRGHVSVFIDG